jgi:hypothetical protein
MGVRVMGFIEAAITADLCGDDKSMRFHLRPLAIRHTISVVFGTRLTGAFGTN